MCIRDRDTVMTPEEIKQEFGEEVEAVSYAHLQIVKASHHNGTAEARITVPLW